MKLSKKIIAAIVATPLFVGSFSAFAYQRHEGHEGHRTKGPHQVRMMKHLFENADLTEEQKEQIKANFAKGGKEPVNLALKEKPSKEKRLARLIEGVNLTETQKNQILANMENMQKKHKHMHKEDGAHVPQTLPELSGQPVGGIS